MLDPNELHDKVLDFARMQENQGRFIFSKNKLWKYIISIDPEADIRNMLKIINELAA